MKYYVITSKLGEDVLVSCMKRDYGALVKKLKTRIKIYVPSVNVKDEKSFVSLSTHLPDKQLISLTYGKVPILERMDIVEYAEML